MPPAFTVVEKLPSVFGITCAMVTMLPSGLTTTIVTDWVYAAKVLIMPEITIVSPFA